MKKYSISDEQLKDLLRDMPKLKDHRDPRDIYRNVSRKLEHRSRKTWVIPTFATVAALFLFAILSTNMLNWNSTSNESADSGMNEKATEEKMADSSQNELKIEENALFDKAEQDNVSMTTDDAVQKTGEDPSTALYEEEAIGKEVVTLSIPAYNEQNMIPVSIVLDAIEPSEKLNRLQEVMSQLNEGKWGLDDYYPLKANLSLEEESNTLLVDVSSDQPYQYGSQSGNFRKAITQLLLTLNLDKAEFTTNKTDIGINLGNEGIVMNISKTEDKNRAFYFYYTSDEESKPYLVPSESSFVKIEDALEAMKSDINTHKLNRSIKENWIANVVTDEKNGLLTVNIANGVNLDDSTSTLYSLEAILLTAKSFNYEKVKFNNTSVPTIGRFNLEQEIRVPVAANKKSIE